MTLPTLSLANATDLAYYGRWGEVLDRGEYVVVRSPDEPAAYLGNQVIIRPAVTDATLAMWLAVFRDEISAKTGSAHVTLNLEGGVDAACLLGASSHGLRLVRQGVMTARAPLRAGRERADVEVVAADDDACWSFVLEGQLADRNLCTGKARAFFARHFARQRELASRGDAAWFCARVGSRLVGSLGLLRCGPVGRLQAVRTAPEFRRRGVASRLIAHASAFAAHAFGATELALVTSDELSDAVALYEHLDFAPAGVQSFLRTW